MIALSRSVGFGIVALVLSQNVACSNLAGAEDDGSSNPASHGDTPTVPPTDPSVCGVTTLASGLETPGTLTFRGNSLYVIVQQIEAGDYPFGTGEIVSVPLAGGTPTLVASTSAIPRGIVADDSNVYWTSVDRSIEKAAIGGGAPVVLASDQDAFDIVLGGQGVVWAATKHWTGETNLPGAIRTMNTDGGDLTDIVELPGGGGSLQIVDPYIYYETFPDDDTETIMRMPLAGGESTALATFLHTTEAFTVDGDSLYYAHLETDNGGTGSIVRVRLDGTTPPEVLASSLVNPDALATLNGDVYWGGGFETFFPGTSMPSSTSSVVPVQRANGSNNAVDVIAPSVVVGGMVPCAGGICWTDAFAGTVMRFQQCAL